MESSQQIPEDPLAQLADRFYMPELSPAGRKWLSRLMRTVEPFLMKKRLVKGLLFDESCCGNTEAMIELLSRHLAPTLAVHFLEYQTIKADHQYWLNILNALAGGAMTTVEKKIKHEVKLHRDALTAKLAELVPEKAPKVRLDTGGMLEEKLLFVALETKKYGTATAKYLYRPTTEVKTVPAFTNYGMGYEGAPMLEFVVVIKSQLLLSPCQFLTSGSLKEKLGPLYSQPQILKYHGPVFQVKLFLADPEI